MTLKKECSKGQGPSIYERKIVRSSFQRSTTIIQFISMLEPIIKTSKPQDHSSLDGQEKTITILIAITEFIIVVTG